MRKHYFLDEYCIIAAERKRRPSDFEDEAEDLPEPASCPFCPGNEEMTPPAIAVYTDRGVLSDGAERIKDWRVRVVPNLFAAMVPEPSAPISEWIALPGHGHHEVIIDSPEAGKGPADLSPDQMALVLRAYRDRYLHYRYMTDVNYVSIFKNWKPASGATQIHSHSQVIAIPIIPPLLKREVEAIGGASYCFYCNIVNREIASDRLISKNDSWILIAPFYSQAPYETWILPRFHGSSLEDLSPKHMEDLATILRDILLRMKRLLSDPAYSFMIFQLPQGYHINIRIQPAISKIAGFERGTGVYINPVPPEQAASELRGA